MKLNIRYFASIREQLGISQETIDIDAPELSIDMLRATLTARNSQTTEALRTGRPVRAAVNQETVDGAFIVREDCEIAFFPPVTGG
ncbi:molybdopterin converting factor subunit 1 [Ralstonia sp. 24A2]|uniref:molybdopterin converting factor subunit 1 n=1 Tax=Ralstonia sp. 24A2 TaxID=3447364 RepID=UPI003F69CC41